MPSERTNYRSRVVLLSVFFAFFLVVLCAFKGERQFADGINGVSSQLLPAFH